MVEESREVTHCILQSSVVRRFVWSCFSFLSRLDLFVALCHLFDEGLSPASNPLLLFL